MDNFRDGLSFQQEMMISYARTVRDFYEQWNYAWAYGRYNIANLPEMVLIAELADRLEHDDAKEYIDTLDIIKMDHYKTVTRLSEDLNVQIDKKRDLGRALQNIMSGLMVGPVDEAYRQDLIDDIAEALLRAGFSVEQK